MEKYINKAKVLIEALPYIKEFNGKKVVIKYGGSAMVDDAIKASVIEDIVLMKLVGFQPVIVHGGGKEISDMLTAIGIESRFQNGLRVTDAATVDVVEMVLAGKVNKSIVQLIQNHDINAVGITGKDGKTLKVKKKLVDGEDIGFVGEITKVNTKLIDSLLENDFIPVIAPIGTDEAGNTYNINADYAASAIAGALEAEKLIFLTDVEGVLRDIDDKSSLISKIAMEEVDTLIQEGVISGGMIPKVECCVEGLIHGVRSVHILDGRVLHSMLLEIFTKKGVGTMFCKYFD
ncbi:N-acetylglutamate 5-phosphotransferase (acetylglutamate kinase) [Petrocella atlantisensis]|uniref:Acetylglutamate kinase n=1 Tax=Petrocella atlantisensis TaxID=2173034 RepID=A0A3P7P0F5_9FIRM|nr:acetylglutamate kinase [Petrocella atlantisensis]MCF8020754.1 acetylglutamate kinase [Vallitaleaceae bacterium]VDN48864.1 N-acetylglutamate 5-phosphotransferase (acetylglutamate kinase) [Petrocella atlantisensis]